MTADDRADRHLKQRYLLVVPVAFARDPEGRIWLDQLWWHDLRVHLAYLENLTVLAPCQRISRPEPGMVEVTRPEAGRLAFVEIFPAGGMLTVLSHLISAIRTVWKAVGRSDLIHSGVAGWPIPVGAIVNPIAVLRRKPLIIVIESAFWRLQEGASSGWKARLRAWLTEAFAKWSLRQAALAVYTHAGYRDTLPVGPKGIAAVLPASWISEQNVISPAEAGAAWDEKRHGPRFLLASRLVPEKGIPLFLETLDRLDRKGMPIGVDVIGSGAMRPDIEAFARKAKAVRIRLLDPVPYGPAFMQLVRSYHATIVPLTGDEQARILYDSFSQAVPVIATDTAGNREVVTDSETGFLVQADDPEAFAQTLLECAGKPEALRRAGLSALRVAAGHTHWDMHRKRADILRELFGTG
ncbi:MAG: glycosyltransferase [Novosphingobium sp.]